jgi:hypothetical protein
MRPCLPIRAAVPAAGLLALALGAATDARADEPLREAYAQGFWDGFAMAKTQLTARSRPGRGAFAVSVAEADAPIWVVPSPDEAGSGVAVPTIYAGEAGMAVIHYKGPWLWIDGDAMGHLADGALDRDEIGNGEGFAEATALDPPAAEQIRRRRAMGINEGAVLVRVVPTQ